MVSWSTHGPSFRANPNPNVSTDCLNIHPILTPSIANPSRSVYTWCDVDLLDSSLSHWPAGTGNGPARRRYLCGLRHAMSADTKQTNVTKMARNEMQYFAVAHLSRKKKSANQPTNQPHTGVVFLFRSFFHQSAPPHRCGQVDHRSPNHLGAETT